MFISVGSELKEKLLMKEIFSSFPVLIKHGHAYLPILFLSALFYTTCNYLFAALHDPGVVPRPNADEVLQTEKEHNIQTDLYI